MMSPGLSVWMSSFCGPAIFSASLTTRATSCSDMSWVRVGWAVATVASGRGRGGGTGGVAGAEDGPGAWVAPSDLAEGEEEADPDDANEGRCCVDDRRLPLTEKRESRSESARRAACATVCSVAPVCAW